MVIDQNSIASSDVMFDFPDIPFSTGPRPWPIKPVNIIQGTAGNQINLLGSVGPSSPLQNTNQTPQQGE